MVVIKWSFCKFNLFVLKCSYSLKHKRDITPFLKTSRVTFFSKVLITNAGPCGYFNAIAEKHLRYSLFVKRIIAIKHTTLLFGLGRTIGNILQNLLVLAAEFVSFTPREKRE